MTGFECPVCGDEYTQAASIREHAWDAHNACHYCGETFDAEERLYVHWLSDHEEALSRIDRKRAQSTVDSLSFGERLSQQGPAAAVGGLSRRTLLVGGGALLAGGGATAFGVFGDSDGETETPSTGSVASAPIPASPDDHTYAIAGSADASVTVTYFGNWKCPHCGRFSRGFLPTLVEDYVVPGKVAIEFRHLAWVDGDPFLGSDAPAAGHAGLAVWNEDPASYWAYHEYVFRHQPPESKRWATADRLTSFARNAGVSDPSVVRTAVEEQVYEDALRASTGAASDTEISGTPTLVVDGSPVSPFDEAETRRRIEDAIG